MQYCLGKYMEIISELMTKLKVNSALNIMTKLLNFSYSSSTNEQIGSSLYLLKFY